jgi:RNA polymerase sigma-70 factor, ECF subfamily
VSARPADPRSDAELVGRVVAGDQGAFEVIVERHRESLFRIAYSMVRDSDVAADLVQDALVRAYVNLARCRDRERFRVWLVTLLRNRVLDHLKERRRRDASLSDDAVLRQAEARGSGGTAPDERYALRTLMADAVARLSEPLREAFVLRHVEQLPVAEVAQLLGTGESAIKMRLARAREQLQRALAPDLDARGGA